MTTIIRGRTGAASGVLCVMALLLSLQVSSAEPSKRALLIAIDDYEVVSDLNGTGNDIALMRSVLISKFGFPEANILSISDAEATRDGIIDAIRTHLIEPSEEGDIVVLHYSGHGSQMRDASGDEIDGYDETLVPHDGRTEGVFDISDDELNALLAELATKTDNVTVIFDSCNSGSISRGAAARVVAPDERDPPDDARNITPDGESMRALGANFVLISGARADQLANETRFEGKTYGAMTYFFANALLTAGEDVVYRDVMEEVQTKVNARFPSQHPQIEGTGRDAFVFGDERVRPVPYVLAQPRGSNRVDIAAGEESGLVDGSELDIYPPRTQLFQDEEIVARVRITRANAGSSRGRIVSGGPVEANSRATLHGRVFGEYSLGVWFDESVDRRAERAIRRQIRDDDVLDVVRQAADTDVVVTRRDEELVLLAADLTPLSPGVDANAEGFAAEVERQLLAWARWFSLLEIDNPSPSLKISLNVRRQDDPAEAPLPDAVTLGERIVYTVTNDSEQPVYVTALALSADGSVGLLYPRQIGAQESLPPDGEHEQVLRPVIPDGDPAATDVLKIIATDRPINPAVFPQPGIRSGDSRSTLPDDPLERLLATASFGLSRALVPEPVALNDWATVQTSVTVRRPAARAVSYAVHTDSRRVTTRGSSQSSICGTAGLAPGDACMQATSLSADQSVLELSLGSTRGGPIDAVSLSEAFQGAYELRDQLGYDRIEPLFEVQAENNADTAVGTRSLFNDRPHDPRAAADNYWSLKYVLAEGAWEQIRENGGNAGLEAVGVLIAHPDTGYWPHAELWDRVNDQRAVRPDDGTDYKDDDPDPLDPLVDTGLIPNPGHGVASGSVIVSPPLCQLADSDDCVTGVAPGAQLVPLRVHTSVVVLNQRNLARAIDAVANDELPVKTPLISIAMGGPPSWALWKAVKKAESNGKLTIAAAGNRVGTVVWPARFKSTIAVAAVNIGCKPWNGSSRGPAVDVAAPGESVWRAAVEKCECEDEDSVENCDCGDEASVIQSIGMGRGTTYATGTTAGAAALWIAYHSKRDEEGDEGDGEFAALVKDGAVVNVFREAVRQSAWRPDAAPVGTDCDDDASWNARRYGAGIVNASKLLSQPLSRTRSLQVASTELPLIDSIYSGRADAGIVEADYRRLFGRDEDAELAEIAYFEAEVAFHYADAESVRDRFDAIVFGDKRDAAYAGARESLLDRDLSPRLREALSAP